MSYGFVKVANAEEIPVSQMKEVIVGEERICIANVNGEFYAIGNVCTHAGCPLTMGTLTDHEVECACHGSKFDVRTGEVTNPPAVMPESIYDLKVEDGSILIKIPK
jgi:3-phenylpropionate/trans-cinnamate dioxygenase ferredoxin subunit